MLSPNRVAPERIVEEPAGVEQGLDVLAFSRFSDGTVWQPNTDESARFRERTTGQVLRPLEPLRVRIAHRPLSLAYRLRESQRLRKIVE